MLQPVTERGYPALPAPTVTATGNGLFHGFGRGSETFVAGPLKQTVEKSTGVRPPRESMDIGTTRDHFPGGLRIETFVVEEFLGLRALRRFIAADAQTVTNTQRAV
ncbi:hypothetical protein D3C80_1944830 [compost metagenome]